MKLLGYGGYLKLLGLIALCAFVSSVGAISVQTLDEQFSQANQTLFRFRIENTSDDTLRDIELRYHIVQKTSTLAEPDIYYLPGGIASWSFEGSDTASLIVYFPDAILLPGDTLGKSSGFAVGLRDKDWSAWTKNDDPSQPASGEFSAANNVEVFSGRKPLMLDAGKIAGCPMVQFVEVSKDSFALQALFTASGDSSEITVQNKTGSYIRMDLGNSSIDSSGQKILRGALPPRDSVNVSDELVIKCGTQPIAYFAYGWKPDGAGSAVKKGLWESKDSFVQADFDMGFNRGLFSGQRLILQKDSSGKYLDARTVKNWKFFRSWEEPGENPMPRILSRAIMQYDAGDVDSLMLEWNAVEGANMYRLVIVRALHVNNSVIFNDTAVSLFTEQATVKIPVLSPGNYIWFAEPLIEVPLDETEDGEEYYFVRGVSGGKSPQKQRFPSLKKKFKKWAKKALKKTLAYAAPITYSIFYEGNVGENTWNSIKKQVNPFGAVQIFFHSETLHTRTNSVKKDLKLLSSVNNDLYIYKDPVEKAVSNTINAFNACFDSNRFCAMKDTRMLAENWKHGFNENNWNKVFPKESFNGAKNSAVSNRCWLTMAQMLNHYKGGNIASDEILYHVRGGFGNTDGGGPVETMQAVNYALGRGLWDQSTLVGLINAYGASGILPTVEGWFVGPPMLHDIIATIESGNVIGLSQLNAGTSYEAHSLVLNGYKIATNGNVYIHLLNTDNMGNSEWRYYCNISFLGLDVLANLFVNGVGVAKLLQYLSGKELTNYAYFSYYIPPPYDFGRGAKYEIFMDSDGDGVVDFDEKERFRTNPQNPDSDGDGIGDYQEILDYKMCETHSGYFVSANNPFSNNSLLPYVLASDFDGDGLHVAIDRDSDGDGYCDGQEKGFLENETSRSCERFDAARFPEGEVPRCRDFSVALLAKDKLQLNDRVTCVSADESYCPIASCGMDSDIPYGIRLGVSAKVGKIYSSRSVLLRDRAAVYGMLETGGHVEWQSSTATVFGTIVENSVQNGALAAYYSNAFDDGMIGNPNFELGEQKIFNSGENVLSGIFGPGSDDTEFIFNSASKLEFNTSGDMLAGSLKFQRGSILKAPTENAVVFHVGEDFQWNGTIETENMISAAQKIKIYYYGTNRIFIQSDFACTIVAPNAEVVVGQAGKNFYGSILAKSIVVHQNTKITWVPFVEFLKPTVLADWSVWTKPYYTLNF